MSGAFDQAERLQDRTIDQLGSVATDREIVTMKRLVLAAMITAAAIPAVTQAQEDPKTCGAGGFKFMMAKLSMKMIKDNKDSQKKKEYADKADKELSEALDEILAKCKPGDTIYILSEFAEGIGKLCDFTKTIATGVGMDHMETICVMTTPREFRKLQ